MAERRKSDINVLMVCTEYPPMQWELEDTLSIWCRLCVQGA